MRAFALLLLLFGPLLSAPAAAGLWTRAALEGQPYTDLYAIGAAVAVVALEAALVRRPGLLREIAIFLLSSFWAGWLWLGLTDKTFDWTRPPMLRTPDGTERIALMLIVLVYLTFYAVAEHTRPRQVS
jgi:hypothetical protein